MLSKSLVAGVATSAIAWSLFAGAAAAQSTAGQAQEVIVTGARLNRGIEGLAVQVNDAKDASVVNRQFFETQSPSENLDQLINFLPGVSYSSEDYTGITSGDLRIHGFDGAHVAIILDGAPLNDTGNYASYPGEYVISEIIDHISVNIGATDVDSPTASAVGGTVNIVTKDPQVSPGAQMKVTGGSYGYNRVFGELQSGAFGPYGTRAYIDAENVEADKWKGAGDLSRWSINGAIYQPLAGTDFIKVAGTWTSERPIFYYSGSLSQLAQYGRGFDYNPTWAVPTAVTGKADGLASPGYAPAGNDTNYYALHPNPVDFSSVRGRSKFTLGHGLTFTFDPSFFYTIANGGGATGISESDPRLIGAATSFPTCKTGTVTKGVDLNGDGDCLDTVALYSPSNTQTYRYSLTSSLLWDLNQYHHFQASYTLDWGRHRQTGEYTTIDPATGTPANVFGARPGEGPSVLTADGNLFQKRNRRSVAILNQGSLNYIGKFLDDSLHVNVGVRLPYFERQLHEYCYVYNGGTEYCDSALVPPGSTLAQTAAILGIKPSTGPSGALNLRAPFDQTVHYNKALPNAGISYRLFENNLFYVSYAEGFSAPKTDDLYTSSPETVKPETSNTYSAGWRYESKWLYSSLNYFLTNYNNRIVQSYDPTDPTLSVDRNVGSVRIDGVDYEAGVRPLPGLNIYGSAAYEDSKLKSGYFVQAGGVSFPLPVKGKKLVLTPDQEYALVVNYDVGPVQVGFDGKYTGKRYISDTNDAYIAPFTVWNAHARYTLPYFGGHSYVQMNVFNIFNKNYFSRSSTVSNTLNVPVPGSTTLTYTGSSAFYYVGAPSAFEVTLNAQF